MRNAATTVLYVTRVGEERHTSPTWLILPNACEMMSYLYGMVATHPTRVDCELVERHEQRIASGDKAGRSVPAWGTAHVREGNVATRLQRTPQPYSRRTRSAAQDVLSRTSLTWCPRPGLGAEVLQPLVEGASMAVIRASVASSESVCSDIRGALRPRRRDALRTDSLAEHVFQLLLERRDQMPSRSPMRTLQAVVWNVLRWSQRVDTDVSIGDGMQMPLLQMLWNSGTTDGLVGCTIGAPLWSVQRTEPRACGICGRVHAVRIPEEDLYAVRVLVSDPVTDEDWEAVPDDSVFSVTADAHIENVAPASA